MLKILLLFQINLLFLVRIIYFQKQGEVFAKIKSIEIDESIILLSIDNDDYILEMNEEEQILLNTSDYEIIDIVFVL